MAVGCDRQPLYMRERGNEFSSVKVCRRTAMTLAADLAKTLGRSTNDVEQIWALPHELCNVESSSLPAVQCAHNDDGAAKLFDWTSPIPPNVAPLLRKLPFGFYFGLLYDWGLLAKPVRWCVIAATGFANGQCSDRCDPVWY